MPGKTSSRGALMLPCLRGAMGDWVYYLSTMDAGEIAVRIERAHNIREAESLEDFLQRDLKDRAKKITQYLRTEDSRFFCALVIGVFGGIPQWFPVRVGARVADEDLLTSSQQERFSDTIGILQLSGRERMFALDGQHRAEAIRLIDESESDVEAKSDQIPVMLVAHVDDAPGKKRSRKLFADINKRAVPVSKGDLAIIDEEDVYCIAARRIYAQFEPLKEKIAITERPETDAGEKGFFTNLLTVVQVARKLRTMCPKARGTKPWDDVNVKTFAEAISKFFTFLMDNVPNLDGCVRKNTPTIATMRQRRNHVLFRPIGLVMLAEVYALAHSRGALGSLKTWLSTADLALTSSLFQNVIWGNGRVLAKGRAVATKLIAYDSGVLRDDDVPILKEAYQKLLGPAASLPKRSAARRRR